MSMQFTFAKRGWRGPLDVEWNDGELHGDAVVISLIEIELGYAKRHGISATPSGPVFSGDEVLSDPLGFLSFMRQAFEDVRVSGNVPVPEYVEGVTF